MLGGVNVHSDYAFTTLYGGYNISVGNNQLNGDQALGFVRERYSLSGGDNQRGKNQMVLINAVVKNMNTVEKAKMLIQKVYSGETITPQDLTE